MILCRLNTQCRVLWIWSKNQPKKYLSLTNLKKRDSLSYQCFPKIKKKGREQSDTWCRWRTLESLMWDIELKKTNVALESHIQIHTLPFHLKLEGNETKCLRYSCVRKFAFSGFRVDQIIL